MHVEGLTPSRPRKWAGWFMNISELFQRWNNSRADELSPLTLDDRRECSDVLARVMGDRLVKGITAADADDARAKMLETLAPSTVRKHIVNARACWAWAIGRGEMKVNPWASVRVLVRAKDKPTEPITREMMDKVYAACESHELRCLFALCREAGLRRSEALALTWANIDHAELTIVPRGGERTTKQKTRRVPITERLNNVLDLAYEANIEPGPCGNLGQDSRLPHKLIAAVKGAGVKPWPKVLHALRGQCESDWLALGLPVMDVCSWLGHSPQVAMKHYHAVQPQSADRLRALA